MHNVFPPGTVNGRDPNPNGANGSGAAAIGANWAAFILPYVEQMAHWDGVVTIVSERPEVVDWYGNGTYTNRGITVGSQPLPIYTCPSHPAADHQMANGTAMEHLGRGNYGANYGRAGYGRVHTDDGSVGGVFGNNAKLGMSEIQDGTSNTLMISELKFRTTGSNRHQDTRGTWGYGVMCASILSTQNGPNSTVPDGVWGCRNEPAEGMPCVQIGSPYTEMHQAARSYHTGGVQGCMADGSTRFFSENISLQIWQALGTRAGRETIGDF